jgi:hypothetical protein
MRVAAPDRDERDVLVTLLRYEARTPGPHNQRRMIVRGTVSALIAVSILGLVALPARAFDAKTFFEQQDRESH